MTKPHIDYVHAVVQPFPLISSSSHKHGILLSEDIGISDSVSSTSMTFLASRGSVDAVPDLPRTFALPLVVQDEKHVWNRKVLFLYYAQV